MHYNLLMLYAYPLVLLAGLITITLFHLLFLFFKPKRFFKEWLSLVFCFHFLTALALQKEVRDVALFASAGYMLWHRIDIYLIDATHGTYPFWPFTIFPYALFWWLSSKIPFLTFSFWVKCLLIPVLFLTAKLIAKMIRKPQVQLLLVTNPLLFLAITFHGQADILLIYFFLLSIFFLLSSTSEESLRPPRRCLKAGETPPRWRNSDRSRKGHLGGELILAGLFMAFSVMTKSWSVMFLPLIVFWLKSLSKIIIYLASFCLMIMAFGQLYQLFVHSSFGRLFDTVLRHPSGAGGYWGLTAILPTSLSLVYNHYRFFILGLGLLAGLILFSLRKPPLLRQIKIFILIVYVLTAGWGLQYAAWIVPFALSDRDLKPLKFYTLLTLPYLGLAYLAIAGGWETFFVRDLTLKLSFLPWGFSLYWLFSELKAVCLSKTASHTP